MDLEKGQFWKGPKQWKGVQDVVHENSPIACLRTRQSSLIQMMQSKLVSRPFIGTELADLVNSIGLILIYSIVLNLILLESKDCLLHGFENIHFPMCARYRTHWTEKLRSMMKSDESTR